MKKLIIGLLLVICISCNNDSQLKAVDGGNVWLKYIVENVKILKELNRLLEQ